MALFETAETSPLLHCELLQPCTELSILSPKLKSLKRQSFYWNESHVLFLHVATLMYCYQHHYWQVCHEDHEQCVVCETVPLIYCYQHHWGACCWSWPVSHVKQSHVDGCCWYIWPVRRMWNSHTDVLQSASLRCLLLIMTSVACETVTLLFCYQLHWSAFCWLCPVCCMWNSHTAVLLQASLRCYCWSWPVCRMWNSHIAVLLPA